jgi:hypothetical protein
MGERHRINGNPAPGTDPEPGIPAGNHDTTNTLREGNWIPDVDFAVPGNPEPGSEPEASGRRGDMHTGPSPAAERFRVPGSPKPGSDPAC